jgi:methyl-accepting chemotaxis protein
MATLSSLVVVAFAFISYQALDELQNSNEQLQRNAQIVQRHMHGDMMHDAIRGDLLAARIAKAAQDTAGNEEARKDFAEHSAAFRQDIDANLVGEMPATIKADMDTVNAALKTYIAAGESALTALQSDADAARHIGTFKEKFTFLEDANEAVSKGLLNWTDEIKLKSAEHAHSAKLWIAAFAVLALLFSITAPVYATAGIFVPLRRMQRTMREIVLGRADIAVPYTDRKDEMGDVAKSVDVFRSNIIQIREMTILQVQQQETVQLEKRQLMRNLAHSFEERVQSIIDNVGSVAGELLETAQSMNGVTNTTHARAASAADESREAARAAQLIATSVEQMSSAAQEIASQISQSTTLVKQTVGQVSEAEIASAQLRSSNAEIGTIVQVIQEITGQINLLALNATIESARAGEAGKGFAVVAAEVKNLASQTSKATEQISDQIARVQQVSQDVLAVFSTIKSSIEKVDQYSAMVAAAAEQQTATTNEISSNMTASVRGVSRVTEDIGKVMEASDEANVSASCVLGSAKLLSEQSSNLRNEVARFLEEVKAA